MHIHFLSPRIPPLKYRLIMGLSEDSYFIFHNPRIVRRRLSAGVEQAFTRRQRELERTGKWTKDTLFPSRRSFAGGKEGNMQVLSPESGIIHTISSYSKFVCSRCSSITMLERKLWRNVIYKSSNSSIISD